MSLSKLRLGMGCKKWRTAEHHYYYPGIIALSINGRWLWSQRTAVSAWQKIRPAKNKCGVEQRITTIFQGVHFGNLHMTTVEHTCIVLWLGNRGVWKSLKNAKLIITVSLLFSQTSITISKWLFTPYLHSHKIYSTQCEEETNMSLLNSNNAKEHKKVHTWHVLGIKPGSFWHVFLIGLTIFFGLLLKVTDGHFLLTIDP